jgi:hypothetical protein
VPVTDSGSAGLGRLLTRGVRIGIGVGAGEFPEDRKATALAGDGSPATAWYRQLDSGFPLVQADGSLMLRASFDPDEANFAWREYCIFTTTGKMTPHHTLDGTGAGAVMLTRRKPAAPLHGDIKTRESWMSWVLQVPVRFSVPS